MKLQPVSIQGADMTLRPEHERCYSHRNNMEVRVIYTINLDNATQEAFPGTTIPTHKLFSYILHFPKSHLIFFIH